ncbi:MAG: hypothetical protein LC107_09455 [Chitinophagales bacterium]|nr:hypothetical protein [Chitinophagales bacterium]
MDAFLDVLKYTIPALIVFATVFYLFRNFLNQQYQIEALKFRQSQNKEVLPLRLQAYERLMMFCERMNIDNLAYRLSSSEMTVMDLKQAMLIAIQQEYEHNVSQQVYISDKLWEIIHLVKEQVQSVILESDGSTAAELIANARMKMASNNVDPIAYAKAAIRNEAQLLM